MGEIPQRTVEARELEGLTPAFQEYFAESETVEQQGLVPLSEQQGDTARGGEERISRERIIDELRPKLLEQKGISRLNLFAYPFNPEERKGYFGKSGPKAKVARLWVDGESAYVLDMADYSSDLDHLWKEQLQVDDGEILKRDFILDDRIKVWFSDYWAKAITLRAFLECYRYSESDGDYRKIDSAPGELPRSFNLPEVLIPGRVDSGRIEFLDDQHHRSPS